MMRIFLPAALAALLGLAACSGETEWNAHDIAGVMPDLAYTLVDENGDEAEAGAYAGKVRVLFFGFTHCPDICPTTLTRVKTALQALPEPERERIRVLFVSVDPERDTPERLREYTARYGPRFVGMTGTQDQLEDLTKRYRVTYGYGEPDETGYYPVSHSSGLFVFGPDGKARLLMNQQVSAEQIAADLERLLDKSA